MKHLSLKKVKKQKKTEVGKLRVKPETICIAAVTHKP